MMVMTKKREPLLAPDPTGTPLRVFLTLPRPEPLVNWEDHSLGASIIMLSASFGTQSGPPPKLFSVHRRL